jgi:hypothetical protein
VSGLLLENCCVAALASTVPKSLLPFK